MQRRPHRRVPLALLVIGALTCLVGGAVVGCAPSGPRPIPSPTPTSVESVAQAFARAQVASDTPLHVPTAPVDPRTLRRLAVVAPVTWYVGRQLDGAGYCAVGVWANSIGSVNGVRCVDEAVFTSSGMELSLRADGLQSRVWIAPDAGAFRRTGWTVLGPSVLVPADGPFATPSP